MEYLPHIILSCLLLPCLLSHAFNVSTEELLAMEKYLKFLNRPPIQIIHTKYGDIFDCVDIYKQPAFDHPLLIDHKIQMRPSSFPNEGEVKDDAQMVNSTIMGLPGGGCPNGTIPIRRTHIEDLIRAKSLANFGKKYTQESHIVLPQDDLSRHRWAHIWNSQRGSFKGTEVWMNVWSPQANKNQFSIAQFWIVAGGNNEKNTIEAGSAVDPNVFGDQHPHLVTYWTADGYQKTGCINTFCPGFVQVSQKLPLGIVMEPISSYGGTQYESKFLTMKDPETGNWWLSLGSEQIGYWPNAIFTLLKESAEYVRWGGEVLNGEPGSMWPPMGSGHFAAEGYTKASYMREMKLIDSNYNFDPLPLDAIQAADHPCYTLEDASGENGRIFYFGGPGADQC